MDSIIGKLFDQLTEFNDGKRCIRGRKRNQVWEKGKRGMSTKYRCVFLPKTSRRCSWKTCLILRRHNLYIEKA